MSQKNAELPATQESNDDIAKAIPLVRADIVNTIIVQFEKQGINMTDALLHANISREMLLDSSNMIVNGSVRSIFGKVYEDEGIFAFVQAVVHTQRTQLIPHFVKTLTKNLTIREVLTKFNLLIRESIPVASQYLEVDDKSAWFCSAMQHKEINDWQEIFNVLYCVELIRSLTNNEAWRPKTVALTQSRTGQFAQNIPSDIQVLFSQKHTKISVDLELLDQEINTAYPEPAPKEVVWHSTFTDTLYTALIPYVHEQTLDIELAANLLNMSTRSLQRKLLQEKNSFRAIKNSLMFNTACDLMNQNLSLTQISVQLGYADIAHFSRAFKRFSGITPKRYQVLLSGVR
ncbi:helix-turn-helix domain-containing protein [Vibrio neonatus]|uniref:helix-turn-helix domain-containing protein n=1 Tax=Vibrio neonatus TaxID=278860 RepID=UPI0021C48C06|nr:helix-turn-helix transcriptional regulator [Vibrio neonatus]